MFLVATRRRPEPHAGAEADELPRAHAPVRLRSLRSYRDLPIRYAESSTLHRNELAGALHGLLRVRHVTQDDAHIFCTEEQVAAEIDALHRVRVGPLRALRVDPHAELSTRPDNRLGTDEEWDFTRRGSSRRRSSGTGIEYVISQGEGTFYGPKIDLHMSDALGRSWQMGTIQADARCRGSSASPTWAPDNDEHTPIVIHRALLGSLERFIGILTEHYARRVPLLARARAGAADPGRREPPRRRPGAAAAARGGGLPRRRRPARRDARASGSARPSSRRSRSRSSTATARRTPLAHGGRESLAVRERGGGQSTLSLSELLERFRAELATISS